jgi:hypothetical protein
MLIPYLIRSGGGHKPKCHRLRLGLRKAYRIVILDDFERLRLNGMRPGHSCRDMVIGRLAIKSLKIKTI